MYTRKPKLRVDKDCPNNLPNQQRTKSTRSVRPCHDVEAGHGIYCFSFISDVMLSRMSHNVTIVWHSRCCIFVIMHESIWGRFQWLCIMSESTGISILFLIWQSRVRNWYYITSSYSSTFRNGVCIGCWCHGQYFNFIARQRHRSSWAANWFHILHLFLESGRLYGSRELG